ncbi:MAG: hypothetical protein A2X12_08045 [Bacteroidetes bacterium GWE2_29_8]|nr:MAG: hypothetical protein A2X12_08045 [Bacteroidetes bacterium GWE2_29_8]OFY22056.1 MAG: hypothetical protein A2X02_04415 [Bacteroidetes bacterium GWF2_29_10]
MKLKVTHLLFATIIISIGIISNSCKKKNPDDNSFNIFSINEDIKLGQQVSAQIASDSVTYPILSETQYPVAYSHIRRIVNEILNSGKVYYKDDFAWETKIIKDDETLNAFCVPGGYLYVYTGLIKYLDTEDQIAGIMAHEIAHADRRHSTDMLTKTYGISMLFDIVLGKGSQGTLTNIATSLLTLQYSKDNEREADNYSVIYMCPTEYNAAGSGDFFVKLEEAGTAGNTPAFLSTHPNPGDRITAINKKKSDLGCTGNQKFIDRYNDFKNSLP